ncbi:MAG: hypothetical protein E7624_07595 [Ruminococcaceae bacterium]|nr:hypothetical protein [Oscillospiraceae bacterium]
MMQIRLSQAKIESFKGNVLPLYLISDKDLSKEDITFHTDNEEVVILHTFKSDDPQSIAHGALLTLVGVGHATVRADYAGESYCCEVSVREMRRAKPGEPLQYFFGDFHDHTSKIHNHQQFADREEGFVIDYLNFQKNDGRLDFAVISDHAVTTNDRDFFAGFTGVEEIAPSPVVIFPGAECEVTVVEEDRFGLPYKNSGEIVTVNSGAYVCTRTWEEYFEAMARSPFAVCVLAHPFISGHSTRGCWNFSLDRNNSPAFKQLIKGVEMGDGDIRSSNGIHEYMYSLALDQGFRVSVTCASDGHGPDWGYDRLVGKTVIMAREKSKEAFLDALLANRFYATETGNVKLFYTVNGQEAASTLPLADTYRFHVSATTFKDDPTAKPTALRVISDYGKIVAEFENVDFSDFDFELKSDTARYFYLRFTDEKGRRTWSAPVWTSREIDPPKPALTPIPKNGFTVTELESGRDASVLVNDDPRESFESELETATYLIDMQKEYTVSALGHYTPYTDRRRLAENPVISQKILANFGRDKFPEVATAVSRFASKYEILTSTDGVHFELCDKGQIRSFSGEEILRFPARKARFVKFRVLSITGREWRPFFDDLTLHLAELSLFA